ncbi:hypothetical protein FKM82_011817 [Ascaphus truei]
METPMLGRSRSLFTCPSSGAPLLPPALSSCLSRYRDHRPTLGRKSRAASTSPTACRRRFSFRRMGSPRPAPPAPSVARQERTNREADTPSACLTH